MSQVPSVQWQGDLGVGRGQGGHMGMKVSIILFLKELMKSRQVF